MAVVNCSLAASLAASRSANSIPRRTVSAYRATASTRGRRPVVVAAAASPLALIDPKNGFTVLTGGAAYSGLLPFTHPAALELIGQAWGHCGTAGTSLPPPTGRTQPPCYKTATITAFEGSWHADTTFTRDVNADVSPCLRGLSRPEVHKTLFSSCTPTLAAIAAVTAAAEALPACAPAALLGLEAACAPVLSLVAPSGSSAVVACDVGMDLLRDSTLAAARALAKGAYHREAFSTATAGLLVLSKLRFGDSATAAPYQKAVWALQMVVRTAVSAGVPVTERDVSDLMAAATGADERLSLRTWYGYRFADAVDTLAARAAA